MHSRAGHVCDLYGAVSPVRSSTSFAGRGNNVAQVIFVRGFVRHEHNLRLMTALHDGEEFEGGASVGLLKTSQIQDGRITPFEESLEHSLPNPSHAPELFDPVSSVNGALVF